MCGIFGYSTTKGNTNTSSIIYEGLKRLEYRGYDSWGIAIVIGKDIKTVKQVGPLSKIEKDSKLLDFPNSSHGIGHMRWATHGKVSVKNAHPHYSSDKSYVIVHNGIVENYLELKNYVMEHGKKLNSDTDSEIIIKLIELENSREQNFSKAMRNAFKKLRGRNTILVMARGGKIYAIRNGSPLVVGVGKGEFFFASDTLAFSNWTSSAILVENNQMVETSGREITTFDLNKNKYFIPKPIKVDYGDTTINKEGHKHFMLKEVFEQPNTLRLAIQYSKKDLNPLIQTIKSSANVYTVGAGTAGYAAGQIAYYLRTISGINATELKAYEIESYEGMISKNDIIIGVSQSGETADTLEALTIAKDKGAKVASVVNMMGSTTSHMSDFPFYIRSGPEIAVISTKVFTAKLAWGYLLAKTIAGEHGDAQKQVKLLSKRIKKSLSKESIEQIKSTAKKLAKAEHAFVLGRGQNYYIAQEAALKVKEIAYKHFEAFSGGELKHGVIALIEKGTPVIAIISEDREKPNMLNALAEVKAREALTIGIAKKNNELFDVHIPTTNSKELSAISNIIPAQLLSYYMATSLKRDPDKPRNLAKSVTVK